MLFPVMTQSRCVMDLNGVWDFKLDDGTGFEKKWYEKKLENAMSMVVPSSYNDMYEREDIREHYGWVFYQKNISLPESLRKERVVLRFEAVTHIAKVFLNGDLIIEHKGGFLPFEVEIQDRVVNGDNLLTVAVDNRIDYSTLPVGSENGGDMMSGLMGGISNAGEKKKNNPNFDFFNYCGIIRPVKIYTTPFKYISDITLVNKVEGKNAVVEYSVVTEGDGNIKVEVYDEQCTKVASKEGKGGELSIENVTLWKPLQPYLYTVKICFENDEYILPYGIRTVRIDGGQFLINEQPFYFKGYGKHEDTFPAGRGENMPMNLKDISLMKWQNANSFRTSHYPYSEEMMRLCDREGIVVIDETPAVGVNFAFGGGANFQGQKVSTYAPEAQGGIRTAEHHKQVVEDMICRDKNYACVVMWSIANEADTTSEGAYEYFKPLYDAARQADPQKRPCTMVSVQNPEYRKDCSIQLSDVYCLNRYYGWYFSYGDFDSAKKALREELNFWNSLGKPCMFTEYGADTVSGMHDTVPTMYSEEYQIAYYKTNNDVLDEMENFIGEQVWNFADFATSQSLLRVGGNRKGIFTRDRKPKMVAYYLRDRWGAIPDYNYKVVKNGESVQ